MLAEIKQLLHDLPPEGSRRLFELWKQIDIPRSARDEPRTPVDQLYSCRYSPTNFGTDSTRAPIDFCL